MTSKLFVGYYKAKVYFQQTQLRKNSVQKLATNNKFESTKFQYKVREVKNSYLIVDAMFGGRSDDGPGELLVNAVLHREDRTHSCAIGNLDKIKFRILKPFLWGLLHGKYLTLGSCIFNLVNKEIKKNKLRGSYCSSYEHC